MPRLARYALRLLIVILLLLGGGAVHAMEPNPSDGVSWWTVEGGGGSSSGGGYQLTGTAGQHDAVTVTPTGGSYTLRGGFWYTRLPASFALWMPVVAVQPAPFVYSEDFDDVVGGEWPQAAKVATAPNGQRFLGEFGNETVTLNLGRLPAHSQVTVAFDLFIIRSWDGNQVEVPVGAAAYRELLPDDVTAVGPDRWRLQADGQMVIDTTFANIPGFPQSYPDNYPADHPTQTGAVALNSLGYRFNENVLDATYRVERTFAHTGGNLILEFTGLRLQGLHDESWGLDNVTVTVGTVDGAR